MNWGIEGGPPTNLFRNGITKASLPVGVVVEYLDGRKVFMGGSAPDADGRSSR